MENWKPKTSEDMMIHHYWQESGGTVFLEVPIGSQASKLWPKGSKIRRIDAIQVNSQINKIIPSNEYTYTDFLNNVKDKPVKLIEAKQKLNRIVIGQIIAGHDMFNCEYNPKIIEDIILCHEGDPALEWVCKNRDIKIQIVKKAGV